MLLRGIHCTVCIRSHCKPDAINERDGSSSSGSFSEDSIIDEGFHSGSHPSSQELIQSFDQGRQVKDGKKARRKSKDCPPQTHVHLGGVRHCRIPLDPEIREVGTYICTVHSVCVYYILMYVYTVNSCTYCTPHVRMYCMFMYILYTFMYILHTHVRTVCSYTYCILMYILHTHVHTAYSCTYCILMYILHTHVHTAYSCTYCILMYILYTHVHTAYSCTYCILMYILHTHVHTVYSCTYCILMYILHTHVHTVYLWTYCIPIRISMCSPVHLFV